MKFIKHITFIVFIIIGNITFVQSQNISIFEKFDDFEQAVILNNDTTYVINFWATWCVPCVKELPFFEAFKDSIGDKKIKVLLVSLDSKKQIDSHLKPFLKKNQYTSQVVSLTDNAYNAWIDRIDPEWSGSIPATLLISGGKKAFEERTFESHEDLAQFVFSFIHSL